MFVQSLYNFFSSSTHHWAIMLCLKSDPVADKLKLNLKSLSVTRWSAWHDACIDWLTCKALVVGYKEIQNAVHWLSSDAKHMTRSVLHIVKKLSKRETALLTVFWSTIVQSFEASSKSKLVSLTFAITFFVILSWSYRIVFPRVTVVLKCWNLLSHF